MGNNVATKIIEEQKILQKELQAEMQEKQLKTQILMQERMRRMQIASAVASAREQFFWMTGVGLIAAFGGTTHILRGHFPPWIRIPIATFSLAYVYTWDFAYGTKTDRINQHFHDVTRNHEYFFNPLTPTSLPVEMSGPVPQNKPPIYQPTK